MPIITRLDRMLADRKMSSKELAARIGLSENNVSRIKTGSVKAIRWSTLEAICRELNCQPGDIIEYAPAPAPSPAPAPQTAAAGGEAAPDQASSAAQQNLNPLPA